MTTPSDDRLEQIKGRAEGDSSEDTSPYSDRTWLISELEAARKERDEYREKALGAFAHARMESADLHHELTEVRKEYATLRTERDRYRGALEGAAQALWDGTVVLTDFIPGTKAYNLQAATNEAHRIMSKALNPAPEKKEGE